MSYRCSLPISRISRKPRVVSSAVGAPVRSMIALVTRVVPCTRLERSPAPSPASRHWSTSPRRAPSAGSGVVVRTLWRRSSPVVSLRRTKSVKVPPMSRPTRNPRIEDPNLCSTPRFDRPLGVRILWPRSLFLLPLFCSSLTLALFHASIGLRSALHPAGTASAAPEPSRPSIAILQLWLLPSVSRGHLELRSIPGAELACISRGDRTMATYVALLNWTEQGVQTVKDTVKRADAFQAAAKKAGCTVREIVWTMGPYDAVGIFEAPDNQVASGLALSLGVQGAVRSLTMPAFTKEDMGKIIAGLPK